MRIFKNDNYSKIFYGYVAILTVFIIVAGVLMIKLCCGVIEKNSQNNQRYFENTYYVTEEKISIFERISQLLFENENIKQFGEDYTEKGKFYNYILISKAIDSYLNIYEEVNNQITLTDLESDQCICREGSKYLYELLAEVSVNQEQLERIKQSDAESNMYFLNEDTGMLTFVFQHKYYGREKKLYCFVSTDKMSFLRDSAFEIIKNEEIGEKKANDVVALKKDKGAYFKSSYYVPELVYRYEATENNVFMFFLIFLVAIICMIAIVFSRKIADKLLNVTYMPIIKAVRAVGFQQEDERSERWEESVKTLIYYNESMSRDLKENAVFLKKSLLRSLVYGIEKASDIFEDKYTDSYGLKAFIRPCRLVLIVCGDREGYQTKGSLLIKSDFESSMEKLLGQSIGGEIVSVDEGKYAYITTVVDKNYLADALVGVLNFTEVYGIRAFITVGNVVDSITDINKSFRSAFDCFEQKSAFGECSIVFAEDFKKNAGTYYYPIDIEMSLIENTVSGNCVKAEEILKQLLAINLHQMELDKENLREFKIMVVGTVNRIINQMNKTVSEIFGEETTLYLEIGASRDVYETEKNIHEVFDRLYTCCTSQSVSKQEKLKNDILEFIEANYQNASFTLSEIASHFYISCGHVNRVLKNSIGKSYKDYIDNVRIKEAKKLLKETMMPINAVSEKVGCTNVRTFIRMFKKYTELTPNEYRLSKQNN